MSHRRSRSYERKRRWWEKKRELDRKHEERKRAFIEKHERNKMRSSRSQDPPAERSSRTRDRRIPPEPDAPEPVPHDLQSTDAIRRGLMAFFNALQPVITGQPEDKTSQTQEGDRQSQRTNQERTKNVSESRPRSSRDQIDHQPSTSRGYQPAVSKSEADHESTRNRSPDHRQSRRRSPDRDPPPRRPRSPDHGYTSRRSRSRSHGRGYTDNRRPSHSRDHTPRRDDNRSHRYDRHRRSPYQHRAVDTRYHPEHTSGSGQAVRWSNRDSIIEPQIPVPQPPFLAPHYRAGNMMWPPTVPPFPRFVRPNGPPVPVHHPDGTVHYPDGVIRYPDGYIWYPPRLERPGERGPYFPRGQPRNPRAKQ